MDKPYGFVAGQQRFAKLCHHMAGLEKLFKDIGPIHTDGRLRNRKFVTMVAAMLCWVDDDDVPATAESLAHNCESLSQVMCVIANILHDFDEQRDDIMRRAAERN